MEKLTDIEMNFIIHNGSSPINVNGEKWVFIPYWFKINPDNTVGKISHECLPEYLKDAILKRQQFVEKRRADIQADLNSGNCNDGRLVS